MRSIKKICFTFALTMLCINPSFSQGAAAPVVSASATNSTIKQVANFTGTVTALRNAELSVATAGLITRLEVDAGDKVAAGDLLMVLDDELARHQFDSAQAELNQALHALADAQRRLEEARRLAPQQSIAETVVKDIESEVAEDEAVVVRARAAAGYRKGILARHQLTAPFSGVISERHVERGEWVTPGQAALSLVSTEQLRLDFQLPEDYLGSITTGNAVSFNLGGNPAVSHKGRIATVVPVSDPTARTFLVRIEPEETISDILPGMSTQATLRMDTGRSGIVVPRDAILRYSDGRVVVWMVDSNDQGEAIASERRVETGLTFDGKVEIISGVKSGEAVIVQGNESLRNGQTIQVLTRGSR